MDSLAVWLKIVSLTEILPLFSPEVAEVVDLVDLLVEDLTTEEKENEGGINQTLCWNCHCKQTYSYL